MSLDTNFNVAPYHDDFSANNNYHRILFRPGTPVQARELTQLQTILQDQISKFGDHVFTEGTIVTGCTISFDKNANYVKVKDRYSNNSILTVGDLLDKQVFNSNGLRAYIVNTRNGFELNAAAGANSELNTLYVKYITTGQYANGVFQKAFSPDDTLTITDSSNNVIGSLAVANSATVPVGLGYAMSVTDGVVFQKGFFVRVGAQSTIVSRYNNAPSGLAVGFNTNEFIITPEIDQSLYDNSQGLASGSPGAHRLKLAANLVVQEVASLSGRDFFSIAEFVDGNPVIINQNSDYAELGRNLARARFEESGNYVISPFNVAVERANNQLELVVGSGVGYVSGYRVELHDKIRAKLRAGDDIAQANNQVISTNFGNYLVVNNVVGNFDFTRIAAVELWQIGSSKWWNTSRTLTDTVAAFNVASNRVATAHVKSNAFNTDANFTDVLADSTPKYKLGLINVEVLNGKNLRNADTVVYKIGATIVAIASIVRDVVGNTAYTELKEVNNSTLVFPFGQKSIRSLRTETVGNNTLTSFLFRTSSNATLASGQNSLTFSSTNALPYSGMLSGELERQFTVITTSNVQVNQTGTITSSGNTLSGSGTAFNNIQVGDLIRTGSGAETQVVAVANSTSMTVSPTISVAANTFVKSVPAGTVIPFSSSAARNIVVSGNNVTLSFDNVLDNFANTTDLIVQYNATRNNALPITKTVARGTLIKINCANSAAGSVGPWSLGIPDVLRVKAVYIGNANNYSTTGQNQVAAFELDNGQREDHYNLAQLKLSSAAVLRLTPDSTLLVEVDNFLYSTAQGVGFFTVDSYPIANTASNTTITREEVPLFVSQNITYDLRDCVDFRPVVANTVPSTSDLASAPINPANTVTYNYSSNQSYIVANDSTFTTNVQYYLGRIDKVVITPQNRIQVLEGNPSTRPVEPINTSAGMTLAVIRVPPSPSLTFAEAQAVNRFDHLITSNPQQNRRYTMQDIGTISQRVDRLEYYSTLSMLESSAQQLLVRSNVTGADRFKNGFLVDPFDNHQIGNTQDPTYNIAIDNQRSEIRPAFEINNVDLVFKSEESSGVSKDNNLITLNYPTERTYVSQPFASKFRNCVENIIFHFKGSIQLFPNSDTASDFTQAPTITNTLDLTSGVQQLSNLFGTQWGDWRDTFTETWVDQQTNFVGLARGAGDRAGPSREGLGIFENITTVTTGTESRRTGTQVNVGSTTNTFSFGDFVTDVRVQPFVRPASILVIINGLKPNTRVYPFFDDKPVADFCVQTTDNVYNVHADRYIRTLGFLPTSTPLVSDGNGYLACWFNIPAGMFNTGNLVFKVVDVDDLVVGVDAITTSASTQYFASNLSVVKATVQQQTREPVITSTTLTDARWVVESTQTTAVTTDSVDPIGQTFYVNEPAGGVDGIYLTKVDLFFRNKSATLGVEIQIREVENGVPLPKILPFGSKLLSSAQVNTSNDGSIATTVKFDSPIYLRNGQEYFICVLPVANNPDYNIWIGQVGGTDIVSGSPIWTNNATGILYTSSTNRVWTPIQTEDLKFRVYTAEFLPAGNFTLVNAPFEQFNIRNRQGTFLPNERVYMTGADIDTNVVAVNNTNTLVVGNNALYANGNLIYLVANNGLVSKRTVANTYVSANVHYVRLTANVGFDSNNVKIGKFRSFANGSPIVAQIRQLSDDKIVAVNSTATVSANFSSPNANTIIIGEVTGAQANVVSLGSISYNALVPRVSGISPVGTSTSWTFRGVNATDNGYDLESYTVITNSDNEMLDRERVILSRSDELTKLGGNQSLKLNATFATANNKISPVVDFVKLYATVTQNLIVRPDHLNGQLLFTMNTNGEFVPGDVIQQGNSYGDVITANSSFIRIGNLRDNSNFTLGTLTKNGDIATNTTVESIRNYSEELGVIYSKSRYISRTVALAEAQDAEDLSVLLTAHRTAGTDLNVYCKLQASADSESYASKIWTRMINTNPLTFSSAVVRDDYVELQYQLPFSVELVANVAVTSAQVAITLPSPVPVGSFVYMSNGTSLIVSKVLSVANNTATIDTAFGSNSNVSVGIIPELTHKNAAFRFSKNNGIVVYNTTSNASFSTFKVFAIKIVPVSNNTSRVPRVQDMRAIALQI